MVLPQFYNWEEPESFFLKANCESHKISETAYFAQSKIVNKKLQECWAAGLFAMQYSKFIEGCNVRLSEKDPPDFEIQRLSDLNVFPFELTEVIPPGRKRGDEYKRRERLQKEGKISGLFERDPDFSYFLPVLIYNSLSKKSKKNYPDNINLLLYVNLTTRIERTSISDIVDLSSGFLGNFNSVWLLQNQYILKLTDTHPIDNWVGENVVYNPAQDKLIYYR